MIEPRFQQYEIYNVKLVIAISLSEPHFAHLILQLTSILARSHLENYLQSDCIRNLQLPPIFELKAIPTAQFLLLAEADTSPAHLVPCLKMKSNFC